MKKKSVVKKEVVPELEDLEALTIEELLEETMVPVEHRVKVNTKNGGSKYSKVVFRLLDVDELSKFDDLNQKLDESPEETRLYYRTLLSTVSISPKFKDDTEEAFKGVNQRFILEYARVINDEFRKNNFL